MYGREIEGKEHTFGVSGKLIMNALVMYDHQTRTLWSQFLGEGVKGPLAGTKLEIKPVTQTTWSLWRGLHPDTLVLDKKGGYRRDSYSGYYLAGTAGVLGESHADARLNRKELVVGVKVDGSTKAYPLRVLRDRPIVNDSLRRRGILVFFEEITETALIYGRMVDGTALTFGIEGDALGAQTVLVDRETGTRWNAFTGRAIEGSLKGNTLPRLPSHLSFWFAWKDWNPNTEVYSG